MKPLNVDERLRLFRYGLIVVVIMTFLATLLYPYAVASSSGLVISMTDILPSALLATVVAVVIAVAAYFGYRMFLMRTANKS